MVDKMNKLYFRKGFWENGIWNNEDQEEERYSIPVPQKLPWIGKKEFLKKLKFVTNHEETEIERYKGRSTCRICGQNNGSIEYSLDNWSWPDGIFHYIKDHNVKPLKKFIKFINEKYDDMKP